MLQRMRLAGFEVSLIDAVAKMMAWQMSNTVKNSVRSDNLLWLGDRRRGSCRYRSGSMMRSNMMVVMMMAINMMMMRYENFVLSGRRRLSGLCHAHIAERVWVWIRW